MVVYQCLNRVVAVRNNALDKEMVKNFMLFVMDLLYEVSYYIVTMHNKKNSLT